MVLEVQSGVIIGCRSWSPLDDQWRVWIGCSRWGCRDGPVARVPTREEVERGGECVEIGLIEATLVTRVAASGVPIKGE